MVPKLGQAATLTGSASYTPANATADPWQGGTITLSQNYTVDKSDITSIGLFSNNLKFTIEWIAPDGVSPTDFRNSIATGSLVTMEDKTVALSASNTVLTDKGFSTTMTQSTFSITNLVTWLVSILFGGTTLSISSTLVLDVPILSANYAGDGSASKVVTATKLIPRIQDTSTNQNLLSFVTNFYNINDVNIGSQTPTLSTWNNYISPWNETQANSTTNGKVDDTQATTGQVEVTGVSRVLTGTSYKSRTVQLPITTTIQPSDYLRVVNLFTKTATLGTANTQVTTSSPAVTNVTSTNATNQSILTRTSIYTYSGKDLNGIALSPVSLTFVQTSILDLKLDQTSMTVGSGKSFQLTGQYSADSSNNRFYARFADGTEQTLTNTATTTGQFQLTLPGQTAGQQVVTIGIENQDYQLKNEKSLTVTAQTENVTFSTVTGSFDFGAVSIPPAGATLMNQTPFQLTVEDTYLTTNQWTLSARLATPFQTSAGTLLPATLYFTQADQSAVPITTTDTQIYQNQQPNNGAVTIYKYAAQKGIYLKMNSSNVLTNQNYQGTVQYTLTKGP